MGYWMESLGHAKGNILQSPTSLILIVRYAIRKNVKKRA